MLITDMKLTDLVEKKLSAECKKLKFWHSLADMSSAC